MIFGVKAMRWLLSVLMGAVFLASPSFAQENSPEALVKNVTEEVLDIIRQDKEIQGGSTRKVIELVDAKVLPHFNFQRMTALAVGRDWNKANPDQKKQLADEFKTLLVRTYANALTGYKDQTIRFKPSKVQSDTEVMVRSEVVQSGSSPIPLDYSLEKLPEGWKVYDVIVAGVSLVTNYRDTFGQEVRANGIDGLVKMLVDRNRQLESSGKK